jgi:hypothetical protein
MGPAFPLAADLRPDQDRQPDAELRLIAALLGVEFDELKRRHEDRRIRRLRGWLVVSGAVGLAFAALTLFACVQRRQAQESAARAATARNEAEKLVEFMVFDLRPKLESMGKLNLLESANERVRAYYETVPPEEDSADVLRRRAAAFQQSGLDLRNHGDVQKTLSILLSAAALREKLVKLSPHDPDAHLALAESSPTSVRTPETLKAHCGRSGWRWIKLGKLSGSARAIMRPPQGWPAFILRRQNR